MEIKFQPLNATILREAASAPEVHAAAIKAAMVLYKDVLLNQAGKELLDLSSSTVVRTVAMHAALLLRTYVQLVGEESLDKAGASESGA